MKCVNCGKELRENFLFCTECGQRIPEPTPKSIPEPEPILAAHPVPMPEPELKPERKPAQPKREKKRTETVPAPKESAGKVAGRVILSVFLGLLLFVSAICATAGIIVRPDNISKAMAEVDLAWILEDFEAVDIAAEELRKFVDNNNTTQEFSNAFGNVTAEDITKFIEHESVRAAAGNVIDDYIDALVRGDTGYHINTKEVIGLLKKVAPEIYYFFGYTITDEDYERIAEIIDENVDMEEISSIETLIEEVNLDINFDPAAPLPLILFSIYPLLFFAALSLLPLFDIIWLHRRRIHGALLNFGIPVLSFGLVFTAASLLGGRFSSILSPQVEDVFVRYLPWFTDIFLTIGLNALGAGAVLITLYAVIHALTKNKPREQKPKSKAAAIFCLSVNAVLILTCGVIAALAARL